MRFQVAVALLVFLAGPAFGKIYGNARFGFFIDVPAQFPVVDPEPENGDGRAFHTADKTADLTASGAWIDGSFAATVEEYKGFEKQDGWTVTYESKVAAAGASYSGKKGDRVFYARMIASCSGQAHAGYRLEYPAADAAKYDAAIKTLNASLKAGTGSCN